MAEVKITKKDLFARIAETMKDDPAVVEMCEKYIAQLSKPRTRKPNQELMDFRGNVAAWLSEQTEPVTQTIAGEALGVSGAKAGAALRWLVGEGVAAVAEPAKKSDPKAYVIA